MIPKRLRNEAGEPIAAWTLPYTATLGSSVRVKGILQETRARLPLAARRLLQSEANDLVLRLPEDAEAEAWIAVVARTLAGVDELAVLPREIQDILAITATERHRWLKDGRLPSAGTRTVKLRGRAKKITFHVFDPRFVEDILDRDVVSDWRAQDAETAAENRRRAAWKTRQRRLLKAAGGTEASKTDASLDEEDRPNLIGWAEFERTGLLR